MLPGSAYLDAGFDGPAPELGALPGVSRAERSDGRVRLYVEDEPARLIGPLASTTAAAGRQLVDVSVGQASLEDVFISLTGRGLR
jgi:ABC-2 type transport system ATP-binding protein